MTAQTNIHAHLERLNTINLITPRTHIAALTLIYVLDSLIDRVHNHPLKLKTYSSKLLILLFEINEKFLSSAMLERP